MNKVSCIASGNYGSIFVCTVQREQHEKQETKMLLWEIKKRDLAIALLRCKGRPVWDMHFMKGETDCFLLPYRERRPLLRFAECTGAKDLPEKLTEACMVWEYPWPFLKLILKNREVHIRADQTLYFTYILDLDEFEPEADEASCVRECAEVLREIGKPDTKKDRAIDLTLKLVEKKACRGIYHTFMEVYRDIRCKKKPKAKWKPSEKQKDGCFVCMLWFVCVLAAVAVILLLSKLILGDIPLLRMFTDTFRQIGTEILG